MHNKAHYNGLQQSFKKTLDITTKTTIQYEDVTTTYNNTTQ